MAYYARCLHHRRGFASPQARGKAHALPHLTIQIPVICTAVPFRKALQLPARAAPPFPAAVVLPGDRAHRAVVAHSTRRQRASRHYAPFLALRPTRIGAQHTITRGAEKRVRTAPRSFLRTPRRAFSARTYLPWPPATRTGGHKAIPQSAERAGSGLSCVG